MRNPIIEIVQCCENCAQPHHFERNKRHGYCGRTASRTVRNAFCRYYRQDPKAYRRMMDELEKEEKTETKQAVA